VSGAKGQTLAEEGDVLVAMRTAVAMDRLEGLFAPVGATAG
jgi:hypothetical protein